MKRLLLYLLFTANCILLTAQTNNLYWQNRKPHAAYWQQDVHYKIKADINEKTDIVSGKMQLTYTNNSPDTLREVFFHLYENAFQPCSYYDDLQRNNNVKNKYGKYESKCLGTSVDTFKHNGKLKQIELDNTIMRVKLDEPLLPNASTEFEVVFKTYFDIGTVRRRNKMYKSYGYKHYNGVHWYPIICVYDAKFKWTTDQHLGREFYADFGTFDVELTFASNFIVEATGVLQNRNEALPDSLRKKLDISNFKDKPLEEKPSVIIPYDSTQRKTWKYHAENVHNFAFTADPTYRIGEAYTKDGVQCIALVQEPHAAQWQPVADYTVKVVELFSRDFGQYAYPKMVVADARDGMEYPMLTLCGGLYPSNKSLIAHEVGHNWFYGMIGNNETYRAMMDEGFTQFITVWALDNIAKDSIEMIKQKGWKQHFGLTVPARDTRAYLGYMMDAVKYSDMPLNTHSDMFNGALGQGGGYRHVYSKTATMLYNLQYVLVDSLFQNAMKHYFNQWKMAHPYPDDFRSSIIDYTKTDLNWFFDQWMETTKTVDYKVGKIKRQKENELANESISKLANEKTTQINFKRKGEMQMPLDFDVVTKNNDTLHYYIPNNWFEKKTEAKVLPRWIGWQKLKPTYTATISTDEKIKDIIIDPTNRLADINMMNNAKKAKVQLHWDAQVNHTPDWRKYHIYTRPELWWNAVDGLKLGWHFNGNYMQYRHKFAFSFWVPTGLAQGNFNNYELTGVAKSDFDKFNYRFDYETGLNKVIKGLSGFYTSGYVEGLEFYRTGFTQKIKNVTISAYIKLLTRSFHERTHYVLNDVWGAELNNYSFNINTTHKYNYQKGNGKTNINIRMPFVAADYSYSYVEAEKINYTKLWKLELRTRIYGRMGFDFNNAEVYPSESMLLLSGANNEQLMDYALLRSKGYVPPATTNGSSTVAFQQGGGLNLRGYANLYNLSKSGAAINVELDFDEIVKIKPKKLSNYIKFDTYLFFDCGMNENLGNGVILFWGNDKIFTTSRFLADAGVGIAFTIKKFGALEKIKPFTLRFDMPFWVSNGSLINENNIAANRWVFGLYRSF
jgi:aminopeptidase N